MFLLTASFVLGFFLDEMSYNCITENKTKFLFGNSLSPMINDGDNVQTLHGYYNCNDIKRSDLITFNDSSNRVDIIKIVKGIPGDNISSIKVDGGWNLILNGEVLKNSQNISYLFSEQRKNNIFNNKPNITIPSRMYIVLGDVINGTYDSSQFGLIPFENITGRAFPV